MKSMNKTAVTFLLTAGFALVGCKKQPPPHEKMCAIYGEYEGRNDELTVLEIVRRIEKEAPELDLLQSVLANAGVDIRYQVFIDNAHGDGHMPADWQCETLKRRWPPGIVRPDPER